MFIQCIQVGAFSNCVAFSENLNFLLTYILEQDHSFAVEIIDKPAFSQNGLEPKNLLYKPEWPRLLVQIGFGTQVSNLGQPSRLKSIRKYLFKSDCIFRRPGNWNVDSIRQTLDSADLIVSPGCNSSRNGSSGFSSGRDEWIPLFQIPGYLLGYLRNFGSIQILG